MYSNKVYAEQRKKQRTHTHTSVQSPFETLTIQHALYQSHLSWRVNIFYCCFCLCWSRCVCFFVLLVAGLLFVIWRVHKPLLECVSKRKSGCKKTAFAALLHIYHLNGNYIFMVLRIVFFVVAFFSTTNSSIIIKKITHIFPLFLCMLSFGAFLPLWLSFQWEIIQNCHES